MRDDSILQQKICPPLCHRCEKRPGELSCKQCRVDCICIQCSAYIHNAPSRLHHTIIKRYQKALHSGITSKTDEFEAKKEQLQQDLDRNLCHVEGLANAYINAVEKAATTLPPAPNCKEIRATRQAELEMYREIEGKGRARVLALEASRTEQKAAEKITHFSRFVIRRLRRARRCDSWLRDILNQRVTRTMHDSVEAKAASIIQKTFRSFYVRLNLQNAGIVCFATPTREDWQDGHKEVAAQLASSEFHKRRVHERKDCIERFNHTAQSVEIGVDKQIEYLRNLHVLLEQKLRDIPVAMSSEMRGYQADSLRNNEVDGDTVGRRELSGLKIARLKSKKANLQGKLRTVEEYLVVLRSLLTKSCTVTKYVASFSKDVRNGIDPIKTVLDFIDTTLSIDSFEKDEGRHFVLWMQTEYKMLTMQLISYDSMQESIIEKQFDRLTAELEALCCSSNLFSKKVNCIDYLESWEAEQLASDINMANKTNHQDESLKHIDRSDVLMAKVKYNRKSTMGFDEDLSSVYVNLKKEIAANVVLSKIEGYAGDGTTKRSDPRISAVSKKSVSNIAIFEIDEWMKVFYTSPWLQKQAADDQRLTKFNREKLNKLVSRNKTLDVLKGKLKYDHNKATLLQNKTKYWANESNLPTTNLPEREQLMTTVQKAHHIFDEVQLTEKKQLNSINQGDKTLNEGFFKLDSEKMKTEKMTKVRMATYNFEDALLRSQESAKSMKLEHNASYGTITHGITRFCFADPNKSDHAHGQDLKSIHQYTSRRRDYLLSTRQSDYSGASKIDDALNGNYVKISTSTKTLPYQMRRSKDALCSLANSIKAKTKHSKSFFVSRRLKLFQPLRNDPELRTMVTTVKKTMIGQKKIATAVSCIALTVGSEETERFCSENMANKEMGSLFYQNRLEIGKHTQVVIWVQTTIHKQHFITDITFGHTDPMHEEFQMLTKLGFQVICHNSMCGGIWVKRNKSNPTAVSHIAVSYNDGDRDTLAKDFDMIPVCLSKYELAKAHLWITHTEWSKLSKPVNIAQMRQQYADYEKMMLRHPSDIILKGIVQKLERKIELEHRRRGKINNCPNADHMQYIVNFLALDDKDLAELNIIYQAIDKDKDGRISTNDIMNFMHEPITLTIFLRAAITLSLDHTDFDENLLKFGETIAGLSTLAMFSKAEVVKFIFYTYNKVGNGCIANSDYFILLRNLHHKEKGVALRALKGIHLPESGYITFDLFKDFDERFPGLLFPIFKLQGAIRQQFMGKKWWENKMKKFGVAKDIAAKELAAV